MHDENHLNRVYSSRTICGPFDAEFRKKFVGREVSPFWAERQKVLKDPSKTDRLGVSKWASAHNLLPQIREIEKIAKSNNKKKPLKLNKYVDKVSELDLYIANKLMNKQSTRQILSKIERSSINQHIDRKKITQNYLRMSSYPASTMTVQSQPISPTKQIEPSLQEVTQLQIVQIVQEERKILSEKELIQKFDNFIIKKHEPEPVSMKDMLGGDSRHNEEAVLEQIQQDKQTLTKIVRNMIHDQNNYTQFDTESNHVKTKKEHRDSDEDIAKKEVKSINWIIRECDQFQNKFKIRKSRSKPKKSKRPQ